MEDTTIKPDTLRHTIVDEAVELLPSMSDTEIKRNERWNLLPSFQEFSEKNLVEF